MYLIPYTEESQSKYNKHMISLKKLIAIMMLYKNTKAMVRSPNGDFLTSPLESHKDS